MTNEHSPSSGAGAGEITGLVVIAVAALALLASAFAVGAGIEIAFLGALAAFAVGIAGFGIHLASREARFRRDNR
ncbi:MULTISPECIES: hypothetical protein [unclassified Rathayibacter]|uniref:hypothetical protein n=1 Tax=unclassified Rathayibacter TaxID=2609250 RepID=UPI000700A063|nr:MULTISPECIES: hypothetical protein [unclassified Rathayibacter]KQQ09729.1 hypothetical protein ASF46_00955 [Rathayibacter sp. Leaf296]KQQ21974.1 hypothetical protein ASF48_01675 [Rathayibacter sp. Leaf299]